MLRTPEEAKAELAEMENAKDVKLGGFKELFSKFVRPALIIGVGMAIFQQFRVSIPFCTMPQLFLRPLTWAIAPH